MPWFAWLVVSVMVVSTLASISSVGKPRAPLSPGVAVAVVIVNGLLIWAVVETAIR